MFESQLDRQRGERQEADTQRFGATEAKRTQTEFFCSQRPDPRGSQQRKSPQSSYPQKGDGIRHLHAGRRAETLTGVGTVKTQKRTIETETQTAQELEFVKFLVLDF